MREVSWTDERGYQWRSLVRDEDSDEDAEQGILLGPPPLTELDWEGIRRDLHNGLVRHGLFSWRDVQEKGGLPGIILGSIKRRVITLYREAEHE